ncbi:STAS domain-containing protein [Actinoallomurus soli]|uniref:STAS domain-containing protein n=1 Tax=Actinoallomurus soli TaxID=2952535 RepID=UPI002092605F|nr:STAS domain-containing protein [Actinoallomurus soli]MCO5968306.1 STAS domain-containing protein [Actinoallomurus soli]
MHHSTVRARLFSRRLPGRTVIAIRGELDIATTPALRTRILTILADTTTPVIIDLSAVSFCDASGLALLVGTQRRARLHGLAVTLAAPRPNVTKLLRITGLDHAFDVRPTLADARFGHARTGQCVAA